MATFNAFSKILVDDGVTIRPKVNLSFKVEVTPDDMEAWTAWLQTDNLESYLESMPADIQAALLKRGKSKTPKPLSPAIQINLDAFYDTANRLKTGEVTRENINTFYELYEHLTTCFHVEISRNTSNTKKLIAGKPRNNLIQEIKTKLVKKYPHHTAKELWPILSDALEQQGFKVRDNLSKGDNSYDYELPNGEIKNIKFKRFQNIKTEL